MTEAMPFLQKYDITFLRPPTIGAGLFYSGGIWSDLYSSVCGVHAGQPGALGLQCRARGEWRQCR